jgi:hypothetical protein
MAQQTGPNMRALWFIVMGAVGILGVIIAERASHAVVEFAGLALPLVMAVAACWLTAYLQDEAWGRSKPASSVRADVLNDDTA